MFAFPQRLKTISQSFRPNAHAGFERTAFLDAGRMSPPFCGGTHSGVSPAADVRRHSLQTILARITTITEITKSHSIYFHPGSGSLAVRAKLGMQRVPLED